MTTPDSPQPPAPAPKGRYMDFVRVPKKRQARPAPQPAPTSVAPEPVAPPPKPATPPTIVTQVETIEQTTIIKTPAAPDANAYTLGGKSPFMTSVNVEKRPLSPFVPKATDRPNKNVYSRPETPAKTPSQPVEIVDNARKKSNLGLAIAIIITIILGAIAGAAAYLFLPH